MKSYIPNNRELRYFEQAAKESYQSVHEKAMIDAVIVKGNYIAGRGYNKAKTHPKQWRLDRMTGYFGQYGHIHAEVAALINSGRIDLDGAEVFVYREDKKGNKANCKPCVSCARALKDAGVKHIYYTNSNGFVYEYR